MKFQDLLSLLVLPIFALAEDTTQDFSELYPHLNFYFGKNFEPVSTTGLSIEFYKESSLYAGVSSDYLIKFFDFSNSLEEFISIPIFVGYETSQGFINIGCNIPVMPNQISCKKKSTSPQLTTGVYF